MAQHFSNCDLRGKTLTGATLRKVDVYDCFLSRCTIEEADLHKCTLTNCTTSVVDVVGVVTLNGGTLRSCTVKRGGRINNNGCALSDVDDESGGPPAVAPRSAPSGGGGGGGEWACGKCTFRNPARAAQCDMCGSAAPPGAGGGSGGAPGQTHFSKCDVRGKTLTGATLRKVDIYDSFLSNCTIEEADLHKCTLTNCTTRSVDFKGRVTLNGGTLHSGTVKPGGSIHNNGCALSNVDGPGAPPNPPHPGAAAGAARSAAPLPQLAAEYDVPCDRCTGTMRVKREWPQTTCPHCGHVLQLHQGAAPGVPVAHTVAPGHSAGAVPGLPVAPQHAAAGHGGAQTPGHGAPPVSVPTGRAPPPQSGRKRAVLCGINYHGTRAALRGCVNDVRRMQQMLRARGWQASEMRVLHDESQDPRARPTKANILAALQWMAGGAQPGDVMFFHFSGHGAQKEDPQGLEEDGMNETILPEDFQRAGMISDDELFDITVRPLPEGARLTAVMDCCHSGTGLDLPLTWQGRGRGWREDTNPYHSLGDVIMFSGCEDDDCSADASDAYSRPAGAMTTALCDVLESDPVPQFATLMDQMHARLRRKGFSQRPQLTSSQPFNVEQRMFLLDDICPNLNPTVGRTIRRRFPPQPKKMRRGPLTDMLLGAGLITAAFIMAPVAIGAGMAMADGLGGLAADGIGGMGDLASGLFDF